MSVPRPHRVLFVGDVVGEVGVAYVERHLPALVAAHDPDLVIVNGENADVDPRSGRLGLGPRSADRLLAAGADVLTGGNHSWELADAAEALARPCVLRPHNHGRAAPGTGACVIERHGLRYGVMNVAGRSALAAADHPPDALEAQLAAWGDDVDAVVVDFHGESVTEKVIFGYAFDGRVTAVLGTHTHVPTLDAQVLPRGTAFVSDVGMTGPVPSMQGYEPDGFVAAYVSRLPRTVPNRVAAGPVALGAVLVHALGPIATAIVRLATPKEETHA